MLDPATHTRHEHAAAADTIAAIATAPGAGGVGIVRLSGPRARAIARDAVRRAHCAPRHAHHVRFRDDARRRRIDDGIALLLRRTGQLHRRGRGRTAGARQPGGAAANWSRAASRSARARARPGEFSERAFLNGKLDLAQAEAVADLIAAADARAARAARRALDGEFSRRVDALADELLAHPRARRGGDRFRRRAASTRSAARSCARACRRPRAALDELLARRRTRPTPARRPARGDRRPAQRRQEFAAQRAGRQRPRHRHRHRRHHPRPAARDRAHRRRRADPGRHRRPARRRRRDRARRHAPRARRTASAPTWRSWCSTRATRTAAARRWPTRSPTCRSALWLHNKADLLDAARDANADGRRAAGLGAHRRRPRRAARTPARSWRRATPTEAGEGAFTARARHVDALRRGARANSRGARAAARPRSARPRRRGAAPGPRRARRDHRPGRAPTTCSATSSPASASASDARVDLRARSRRHATLEQMALFTGRLRA